MWKKSNKQIIDRIFYNILIYNFIKNVHTFIHTICTSNAKKRDLRNKTIIDKKKKKINYNNLIDLILE